MSPPASQGAGVASRLRGWAGRNPGLERKIRKLWFWTIQTMRRQWPLWVPPGHFYSPLPSLLELQADEERIFRVPPDLPGIDLRAEAQLALLSEMRPYVAEMPFPASSGDPEFRFWLDNGLYPRGDALCYYLMLRHLRPRRIIEVGSGMSTALALDVIDRFLDDSVALTCIEPYPDTTLNSILRPRDRSRVEVKVARLQDVALDTFDQLGDGDVLFIDSTHVAKTGSDVNYLFFEILPRLAPGVHVHIHDVHYPFEYPRRWVFELRAWNEAYLLRAFLSFNAAYEIVLFNTFLAKVHSDRVDREFRLADDDLSGSIWLRRSG